MGHRHREPSTRRLAIEYLTTIALSHHVLHQRLLELDAIPIVEQCEACAYEASTAEWSAIVPSSRLCLEVLHNTLSLRLSSLQPGRFLEGNPSYSELPEVQNGFTALLEASRQVMVTRNML